MITLGKTGFRIYRVGFGGIPIQRVDENSAIELINISKEQGMNFIDTARGYTISEEVIGNSIRDHKNHWIIATKSMARTYESMKKDIEISLKNLKRDYIDLYQIHNLKEEEYDNVFNEDGAYRALVDAKKDGKIREIGITSHTLSVINKAIGEDKFSTIQFPYNIVENQGEEALIKAKEKNIGTIIMKPLAGGALEDGGLALRYILSKKFADVVIPGMDSKSQVMENSKVAREEIVLTDEEINKINEIKNSLGNKFCRRCGYCLPCTKNIDIPTHFLLEGYYSRYDLKEWAVDRYKSLQSKASICIECGVCEKKCPYDLPIIKMLKAASDKLEKGI